MAIVTDVMRERIRRLEIRIRDRRNAIREAEDGLDEMKNLCDIDERQLFKLQWALSEELGEPAEKCGEKNDRRVH